MLKVVKKVSIFMTAIWVSVMIPFLSIQATGLKPSVQLTSTNGVSELVSTINSYTVDVQTGFNYLSSTTTSSGGSMVSVDTFTYNSLSNSDKQKVMTHALTSISNSSLVAVDKTKLYNFIAETDTAVSAIVRQLSADGKTDFYTAYSYIEPFSGTLGTLLALVAIGLFAGLLASVLIDLSYLGVPIINVVLTSNSKEKPKLVSLEAYKAFVEGSDKSNKKDVLLLYISKKWLQFIIIAVCVLYLTSGLVWGLIADIIDLFSGILG